MFYDESFVLMGFLSNNFEAAMKDGRKKIPSERNIEDNFYLLMKTKKTKFCN